MRMFSYQMRVNLLAITKAHRRVLDISFYAFDELLTLLYFQKSAYSGMRIILICDGTHTFNNTIVRINQNSLQP